MEDDHLTTSDFSVAHFPSMETLWNTHPPRKLFSPIPQTRNIIESFFSDSNGEQRIFALLCREMSLMKTMEKLFQYEPYAFHGIARETAAVTHRAAFLFATIHQIGTSTLHRLFPRVASTTDTIWKLYLQDRDSFLARLFSTEVVSQHYMFLSLNTYHPINRESSFTLVCRRFVYAVTFLSQSLGMEIHKFKILTIFVASSLAYNQLCHQQQSGGKRDVFMEFEAIYHYITKTERRNGLIANTRQKEEEEEDEEEEEEEATTTDLDWKRIPTMEHVWNTTIKGCFVPNTYVRQSAEAFVQKVSALKECITHCTHADEDFRDGSLLAIINHSFRIQSFDQDTVAKDVAHHTHRAAHLFAILHALGPQEINQRLVDNHAPCEQEVWHNYIQERSSFIHSVYDKKSELAHRLCLYSPQDRPHDQILLQRFIRCVHIHLHVFRVNPERQKSLIMFVCCALTFHKLRNVRGNLQGLLTCEMMTLFHFVTKTRRISRTNAYPTIHHGHGDDDDVVDKAATTQTKRHCRPRIATAKQTDKSPMKKRKYVKKKHAQNRQEEEKEEERNDDTDQCFLQSTLRDIDWSQIAELVS